MDGTVQMAETEVYEAEKPSHEAGASRGGSGFGVDTTYPRSIEGILRIISVVGCRSSLYE